MPGTATPAPTEAGAKVERPDAAFDLPRLPAVPARLVHQAHAAAAQAGPRRQRRAQHQPGGDGRVDRIAAGVQRLAADDRGLRLVRHHHGPLQRPAADRPGRAGTPPAPRRWPGRRRRDTFAGQDCGASNNGRPPAGGERDACWPDSPSLMDAGRWRPPLPWPPCWRPRPGPMPRIGACRSSATPRSNIPSGHSPSQSPAPPESAPRRWTTT